MLTWTARITLAFTFFMTFPLHLAPPPSFPTTHRRHPTTIGYEEMRPSEYTPLLLHKPPVDSFNLAYLTYFTLGAGFLLPWNAFITAVDYFTYLYPSVNIDRIFAVTYMLVGLVSLGFIVLNANVLNAFVRINLGLGLFVLSLGVVPVIDLVYVKGEVGLYWGFYVTAAAVGVSGIGDALVQSGIVGNAGELPERYMQATIAGTAASGVLVSLLRVFTKAVYTQDAEGLRSSANLYFVVSILVMIVCIVFYNVAHRFPIIKYYQDLKVQAVNEEKEDKASLGDSAWRSALWEIIGRVKWLGVGILVVYLVTLSIFPGYITEDVHSQSLKDWYPILLIAFYNVFDLIGKCITAVYMIENSRVAVGGSIVRLLFLPLFYSCLHGPKFFRAEIPVTLLTCLLALTNGYLTSVLMIMAPKSVPLQHSETAGIVIVFFQVVGLAVGSIVAWFWVI